MTVTSIPQIATPGDCLPIREALLIDHGLSLPKRCRDLCLENVAPAVKIANAAEAFYAAAKMIEPGEARDAFALTCAQFVGVCIQGQWHEVGVTERGPRMIGACFRILGLGDQAEAQDPALLDSVLEPIDPAAGT